MAGEEAMTGLRVLNLFTGIGGGAIAEKTLGMRAIGYVEWDAYCCRVLRERISEGRLDEAPVHEGDVHEFVRSGVARLYRGVADVVSGGPPCQPFSTAGKRKSSRDERNMWPAFLDVVRAVQPRFVFIENVAGLASVRDTGGGDLEGDTGASVRYLGVIFGDLASLGYDIEWTSLRASDVGATHRRERLWILAHSASVVRVRTSGGGVEAGWCGTEHVGKALEHADRSGRSKQRVEVAAETEHASAERRSGELPAWPPPPNDRDAWERILRVRPDLAPAVEPEVCRVADAGGGSHRLVETRTKRLKALGNAQVPAQAVAAWRLLMGRIV